MADPSTYRPNPGEVPTEPGVYKFRDAHSRVIYVGKAKSLRQRLSSYFQNPAGLHPRTFQMVTTAASVEWTVVSTEVESLALEYAWIKEFDPRFNVKYRDDKSYPYLAVTMGEDIPRAQVMRGKKRTGTRYFGPYSHAWAIRETVDLLLRVFPIRSCSAGVYRRAARSGRPCLLGYIDKCSAPCVGRISPEDHRALAEDFCTFMAGGTGTYTRRIEADMHAAAAEFDFERAARLRDDLAALAKVVEKNAVVLADGTSVDIFAMATDELEASVQVFHIRDGRVRGQRGWVTERVEELTPAELIEALLLQVYGDAAVGDKDATPREILVPVEPSDHVELERFLGSKRGSKVQIRVPQRGDKRSLAQTVHRNAEQALALHKNRRAGDLTTRSQALADLQEHLNLVDSPLRVECYDVSHTAGTYQVASMVVFEDGSPRKNQYRRFNIRGASGDGARDDTEAIAEVITRRFRHYLRESSGSPDAAADGTWVSAGTPAPADRESAEELPGDGELNEAVPADVSADVSADGSAEASGPAINETKRFAYPPNLVVVDGGQPQVAAASRALSELGIEGVGLIGLAKRLEEVWLPDDEYPVILPRASAGLYLLQRVRDEAHRFAISHHRKRRSSAMTRSELDAVPGLGPARQRALLKHFGSVRELRKAGPNEVAAVPGIGPKLAETIVTALSPPAS